MNSSLIIAEYKEITDKVTIRIPTIREILEFGDVEYFNAIYMLSSVPFERMGELAAHKIDYENITEYQLFMYSFMALSDDVAKLLFKDLLPSNFHRAFDKDKEILFDRATQTTLDEVTCAKIANFFRTLRGVKKVMQKAANKTTKKYLVEKELKKFIKAQRSSGRSYLDTLIIDMVNTPEFGFTFEECLNSNLYLFNASVRQVIKRVEYDQVMSGVCHGTIDVTKLDMEKIHWLSND